MQKFDYKLLFSALWAVIMINMIKADVLSLYIPGALDELLSFAGDTPVSHIMLFGAIIMEIPTLMIVLSLILPYKMNRSLNLLLSIFTIVFIWAGGSEYPHYIFIASIETMCLLIIFGLALKWKGNENTL